MQTQDFPPCLVLNSESQNNAAHPEPQHDAALNPATLKGQQKISLHLDGSQLCELVVVVI